MTVLEKDRFDSSRYDQRHGGPYGRAFDPHYFEGATHSSEKIELKDMSAEEIAAYTRGFNAAEEDGIQKDWG
jgi:hypothetical protein